MKNVDETGFKVYARTMEKKNAIEIFLRICMGQREVLTVHAIYVVSCFGGYLDDRLLFVLDFWESLRRQGLGV